MSAETAIAAWLKADPDVQSQTAGRIYPMKLPETDGRPAVTWEKTSGERLMTLTGLSGLAKPTFVIRCWGKTYADAKTLATAVRGTKSNPKLDGFRGVPSGDTTKLQAVFLTNEIDVYEAPAHGDDVGDYHTDLDFEVWTEDV